MRRITHLQLVGELLPQDLHLADAVHQACHERKNTDCRISLQPTDRNVVCKAMAMMEGMQKQAASPSTRRKHTTCKHTPKDTPGGDQALQHMPRM